MDYQPSRDYCIVYVYWLESCDVPMNVFLELIEKEIVKPT